MARRFKIATVLNMLGLIVAFSTFYMLMTQIIYQRTYNHEVKDHERIYLMVTNQAYQEWDYTEHVCRPFADALQHFPQVIESYSLVRNDDVFMLPFKKEDNSVADYQFNTGNNTVVSALGSECLDGNIEWTDNDSKGIIIHASVALDYFGTTQAAGKTMNYVAEGGNETEPMLIISIPTFCKNSLGLS